MGDLFSTYMKTYSDLMCWSHDTTILVTVERFEFSAVLKDGWTSNRIWFSYMILIVWDSFVIFFFINFTNKLTLELYLISFTMSNTQRHYNFFIFFWVQWHSLVIFSLAVWHSVFIFSLADILYLYSFITWRDAVAEW